LTFWYYFDLKLGKSILVLKPLFVNGIKHLSISNHRMMFIGEICYRTKYDGWCQRNCPRPGQKAEIEVHLLPKIFGCMDIWSKKQLICNSDNSVFGNTAVRRQYNIERRISLCFSFQKTIFEKILKTYGLVFSSLPVNIVQFLMWENLYDAKCTCLKQFLSRRQVKKHQCYQHKPPSLNL
jgi:hypothetical protein